MLLLGVFLVGMIAVLGHGSLQGVDQATFPGMALTATAIAVETADRQGNHFLIKRLVMLVQHLAHDTGETDAGQTAGTTGQIFGNQRTGQTHRLKITATTIGRDDRNAHLGHDFQQAIINALLVAFQAFAQAHIAEQATGLTVGDCFLRQIGIYRGRTASDQHGKILHIHTFTGAHIKRSKGAQRLADQIGMHGTGGEDHRDRCPLSAHILITQDDMGRTATHGILGLDPDTMERILESVLTALGREGTIDGRCRIAHIFLHGGKFGIGQHRGFQLQQVALALVLVQNVAEVTQTGAQAHHPAFAQTVDRRVGHLTEILPEEVVQPAIMIGQHGNRRVVAHGANRFLGILDHRMQDQLHILHGLAIGGLAPTQFSAVHFLHIEFCRLGDEVIEFGNALDPFTIGLAGSKLVLQLPVVPEFAFGEVDRDHLAGTDAALLLDLGFIHFDHAGLGADNQQAIAGDGIAHRAQAVTVHAAQNPAPVIGGNRRRAVPWLHHGIAIAVQ